MKKNLKFKNLVLIISCCFLLLSMNAFAQDEEPSARYGHTFVAVNDSLILLFGGANSSKAVINELWAYNKDNSKWEKKEPNNPLPRKNHAAVANNGKMIIFHGQGTTDLLSDIWQYDISTNSWEELPSGGANVPEARKNFTASVIDDNVYIVGGETASGPSDETWVYNYTNGTWAIKAPYLGAVMGHAACAYNSMLYIFGGSDPPSFRNDMWSYNLSSNSWDYVNAGGSIPNESTNFAYSSSGKYFYIIGGDNNSKTVFDKSYMFDIDNLTWTELGDIPPLTQFAAAFVGDNNGNGELYTFGGLDEQGDETDTFLCYYTIDGIWVHVNIPYIENNKQTIDVFPNPFHQHLTINNTKNTEIKIYNINGSLIKIINGNSWDGKDFKGKEVDAGVYVLETEGYLPVRVVKSAFRQAQ